MAESSSRSSSSSSRSGQSVPENRRSSHRSYRSSHHSHQPSDEARRQPHHQLPLRLHHQQQAPAQDPITVPHGSDFMGIGNAFNNQNPPSVPLTQPANTPPGQPHVWIQPLYEQLQAHQPAPPQVDQRPIPLFLCSAAAFSRYYESDGHGAAYGEHVGLPNFSMHGMQVQWPPQNSNQQPIYTPTATDSNISGGVSFAHAPADESGSESGDESDDESGDESGDY